MSSEKQTGGGQELDQWFTVAMASLRSALNKVLDLDAGLADAQLPDLQTSLIRNLDDVLDLDTGLGHIMPTPSSIPNATQPIDHATATATLHTFAIEFASRPPHDRLAARTWFPRQELTALQSIAQLAFLAHTLGAFRDSDDAFTIEDAFTIDGSLTLDDAVNCARDAVRALKDAYAVDAARSRARDAVWALDDAFTRVREAIHVRARDAVRAVDDTRAFALAISRTTLSRYVIDAVDLLDQALSHMMGADLTKVDLREIPLAGVRWSYETRWPEHREDQIRRDSFEVEPGIFEILPDTATGSDTTTSRPTRNAHVTLRSAAVFDLISPRIAAVPVKVELRYDTRDPYAVVTAFRTGRAGWVEWIFARDLLAHGLIVEAGNGDVRIRPAPDDPEAVVIELSSPSGRAMFKAPAQELKDFLNRTYDAVAPGNERRWVDVDGALSNLTSTDQT